MPRFKSKSQIPRISLWGIDSTNTFNAVLFEGEPPHHLPQYHPHQKDLYVISYCLNGRLESFINFKPYFVNAGDIGLINPNQIHYIRPLDREPVRFMVLAFHPSFLGKLELKPQVQALIRAADVSIRVEHQQLHKDVVPMLISTLFGEFQTGGRRITYAIPPLMSLLLTRLCELSHARKPTSKAGQLYYQFLEKLEDHVRKTHRVSDYAQMLKVSEKTLNRACQSATQGSASLIIQQKINAEAQRLLQYDRSTAKEIAYRLGFSDPAQFSKFFKQNNGLSPLDYRAGSRIMHRA